MTGGESEDTVLAVAGLTRENHLLRRIIDITSGRQELHVVANHVAAVVTATTGADVCFVHVLDEDGQRLVLAGATPPFDGLAGTVTLGIGEGVAGWVAAHGEPAVVADKWADPRYRYIPALRGEDYQALVSVPMLVDGDRVVGVLNVHAKEPDAHGPDDVALLSQVASLLARVVENAGLHERLAQREAALERFARRTVEAQEVERRRVAGDIHDGISQRLISLWFHLLAAEAGLDDPETASRALAVAKQLTTAALDEARVAIKGLRPPMLDDLGLGPSLESLARSIAGVEADVDARPMELPGHVEVTLYRIAQECIQNVVKHSGATRLGLRLERTAAGVSLEVVDDGDGFDVAGAAAAAADRSSYGLTGMQERAELIGARLEVTSARGRGTSVHVFVPDDDASVSPPG